MKKVYLVWVGMKVYKLYSDGNNILTKVTESLLFNKQQQRRCKTTNKQVRLTHGLPNV